MSATLPSSAIATVVDCIFGRYRIFGIGVDRPTIVLAAFL
jgi:hypothetical protein